MVHLLSCTKPIINLVCPPEFCVTFVSISPGHYNSPKRKWRQCLRKIFGGQTRWLLLEEIKLPNMKGIDRFFLFWAFLSLRIRYVYMKRLLKEGLLALVEMGFLNFVRCGSRCGASLARPFGVRGSSAVTKAVINRNTATESRNNRRCEWYVYLLFFPRLLRPNVHLCLL